MAEMRGATPQEMGMKQPEAGTVSILFLLFGELEGLDSHFAQAWQVVRRQVGGGGGHAQGPAAHSVEQGRPRKSTVEEGHLQTICAASSPFLIVVVDERLDGLRLGRWTGRRRRRATMTWPAKVDGYHQAAHRLAHNRPS